MRSYACRIDAQDYIETLALMAAGDIPDLRDLLQRPAWHAHAACRGRPDVSWFPERGERTEPAKAICHGCPVSTECLDAVLDMVPSPSGIWAGTSGRERRQMRMPGAA